ncbi:unnamed protein product [Adineta steineri]|uniref:Uncharacterized protein n=1 Tax=Adineta steineri TaxID=433720 RepID=A0A814YL60_9BILA|nr:unnamed protein product [Adineta steineri]CAF1231034.1 unnamed protein product [Adineta steineri]
MFKLTSTKVIDLTHSMLKKQSSDLVLETIDKNPDNNKIEHIVQKRSAYRFRPSRHHHHHRPLYNPNIIPGQNPYIGPLYNPNIIPGQNPYIGGPLYNPNVIPGQNLYPGSWPNVNPMGIPPYQPRYRRSLSIFDNK